jgi:hypothetical protein
MRVQSAGDTEKIGSFGEVALPCGCMALLTWRNSFLFGFFNLNYVQKKERIQWLNK